MQSMVPRMGQTKRPKQLNHARKQQRVKRDSWTSHIVGKLRLNVADDDFTSLVGFAYGEHFTAIVEQENFYLVALSSREDKATRHLTQIII